MANPERRLCSSAGGGARRRCGDEVKEAHLEQAWGRRRQEPSRRGFVARRLGISSLGISTRRKALPVTAKRDNCRLVRSSNRGPSEVGQDTSAARRSTLAGAWAGRGFRYQDAVAASLAVLGLVERRNWVVSPEGGDDITIVDSSSVLELQARSHRGRSREVTITVFTDWLVELWTRHADETNNPEVRFGLVVDRPIVGVEETGLIDTLREAAAEALTTRLKAHDLPPGTSTSDLLARSHLIVVPEPARAGTELLRNHLNCRSSA